MAVEKSGVHLTGADSGWPVGAASEPSYRKDGTGGTDSSPKALSSAAGVVTDATSANEVQTLTLAGTLTGGTWKPSAGATAVAYNPSAAAVQAALEADPAIGVGNVTVSGGPTVFTVTFKGALGDTNVAQLAPVDVNLVGTGHGVSAATGTPGSP